ncbi:MAG TPA: DapH/DapD/GlmU-related protein [Anaerolineales bacterium]|nr:DapH/DapD/GlmU-related protein [Anaerolineales bacterium]
MSDYFVHESSYVDEGAQIGTGTKIWHFCHVMPRSKIGERCNIGQNVLVASDVTIGNNVKIQNNVSLYTGVIVEDDVFLGPSMVFTNVVNPRSHVSRKDEYKTTLVRKGASIGANATIVCGVTLGKYCFVGAGAVVTKDVPDYALVYGSPATLRGWMCQCGEQLSFTDERAVCLQCGDAYRNQDSVVRSERGDA